VKIRVALLQMLSSQTDAAANLAKGDDFCRRAAAMGADIALFPEMWNTGYTYFSPKDPASRPALEQLAIGPDDPFITHFQNLAAELNLAIALTYLERWPEAPRDTLTLFDRTGRSVLTYAKVHTCDFDMEAMFTPGDDFYVAPLETAQGPVNIGAMVCFDREFPESARILMLKGAELILVPNACSMEQNRTAQLRTRAFENMLGVALANYAAPQENGHSMAFDPLAFDGEDGPSRDTMVIQAGEAEGIFMAAFDLARIREMRAHEAWGNAYRKPRCYGLLVEEQVQEPFIRKDARR
jgi:predicted amidohydrolase